MADIPSPPVDILQGCILQLGTGQNILIVGGDKDNSFYKGKVYIRYGFALMHSTDYIFPSFAMDDFRREYEGVAAVEFMVNKGESYPRADVSGFKILTGEQLDLFFKEVDIAHGLSAFPCTASNTFKPISQLNAVFWPDDSQSTYRSINSEDSQVPSLLRYAVPSYLISTPTLSDLDTVAKIFRD